MVIKRILKNWLRKRIIEIHGTCSTHESVSCMERRFQWVYNAPITQWNDRLWCLPRTANLNEAEELFRLLHKK